jgi:DNA topoisomerase-3
MLILTEKPSVAAAFAAALSVPRKDGHWENDDYCIVNALGHLLEDFMPEDYDPALKKWSLDALPIIPNPVQFKPIEKTKAQLALVKKCFDARRADELLLATDAEREGEVIGAEILDYVGFTGHDRARRFWVSEALTKEVVLAGIANARPLADYASHKDQGFARQRADWLVGMNLSRLVAIGTGKSNIAVGRVQSAVLAAIHERETEIAAFKKQKYREVSAALRAESVFKVKLINPDNAEFPNRFAENAPLTLDALSNISAPGEGTITSLSKEQKSEPPPRLLNLTALQKEAHKRFSLSPEETLAAAQALYEKHKCRPP